LSSGNPENKRDFFTVYEQIPENEFWEYLSSHLLKTSIVKLLTAAIDIYAHNVKANQKYRKTNEECHFCIFSSSISS